MTLIATMATVFVIGQTPAPPIQLRVSQGNKKVGEVVNSFRLTPEGNKVSDTRMSIELAPVKATITITTTVDALGFPVRKIQKSQIGESGDKVSIIVDFSKTNAHYVREIKGVRTVSNYPVPEGISPADPSEFWFLRDRPGAGTKVKFASFNIDLQKWEIVETTYVGKKTLIIDGAEKAGFEVSVLRDGRAGTLIVDERGQILQMVTADGLSMERTK